MTIEQNFEKIEMLLEQLEAEDISLEASFKAYEEGMKLIQKCNATIDKVEKKVLEIVDDQSVKEFE